MWESILKFMQQNDPYRSWLEAPETKEEKDYVLGTLLNWLQDDLFLTNHVEGFLNYLES
jgi:phage terminase large subunit-like protein